MKVIVRVHPVNVMNVEQRLEDADPQTKTTDLGHSGVCFRALIIHIQHSDLSMLLSLNNDTHFSIPWTVEG